MSATQTIPVADPCGNMTGHITVTSLDTVTSDPAIDRARATWTAGDFGRIAAGYSSGAAAFVDRLQLAAGERVLDVACGTGNLALPAARHGATVTGIDIAPNLIEAACRACAAESLAIRFDVGAAEALPYDDGAFDTVISMFGVMFSGRPEAALSELLRVTRPGGRIALANWMPDGFTGRMLRAHVAFVPPPPGAPSSLAWGNETVLRERLQVHADRIRSVTFVPRTIDLAFPLSPAGVVELFRAFYGPTVRTFAALDAGERAALTAELVQLWESHTDASHDTTSVAAEYLEVLIERK